MPPCQGGCREFEPRLPLHKGQEFQTLVFYSIWNYSHKFLTFIHFLVLHSFPLKLFLSYPCYFWHRYLLTGHLVGRFLCHYELMRGSPANLSDFVRSEITCVKMSEISVLSNKNVHKKTFDMLNIALKYRQNINHPKEHK